MKKRHLIGAVALTAGFALGLTGCAPSGGGTATSAEKASKDLGNEKITLKILDFWQNDEGDWMNSVVKGFEEKYPNVTIKRTTQDWGQVNRTVGLRLSDADGPDIALVNNGWQATGTFAKGGRILNLDEYSKLYGWSKEIPETILRQEQFSSDGSQMGTGSLYATPAARSSLIGVYYNKKILDSLGIAVPKTLVEFETAAAKVKAAGQVPIAYGSQDKGSSTAVLLALQDLYGSPDKISDFVYSNGSVKLADTGMTKAAATVKDWSDKGYFTPNAAGIQYADSQNNFLDGKAAFRFEYTGSLPFSASQKEQFGYVQFPNLDSGKTVATGASAANLAISAKSKHPNAAAAFLDYMASKQAAQAAVDHGYLPLLHSDVDTSKVDAELATEITAQQNLDKDDGYVPYFDWSTPTMLDTIGGQVQQLLAGQVTPEQLTKAGQADYDAFQEKRQGN